MGDSGMGKAITTTSTTTALVICDLQPDALKKTCVDDEKQKEILLSSLGILLEIARARGHQIIYSGLRFSKGYQNVSPQHKLYGALRRLCDKVGEQTCHWFLEGWEGSDIVKDNSLAPQQSDIVVWRSTHLPHELVQMLQAKGITKVWLAGTKASGSLQVACQMMMDVCMEVTVIKDCVGDETKGRLAAILDHLLPQYATSIISLKELVDDQGGLDALSPASKESLMDLLAGGTGRIETQNQSPKPNQPEMTVYKYVSDCQRRGHGARYVELLLERDDWKRWPTQTWYEDFVKGEFLCPLGKKVVDFCDEPTFSKVSMYLSGREHLDEKDKVIDIAGEFMPQTYHLVEGQWIGNEPRDEDLGALDAAWFVKEADKNLGGAAIVIVSKPSEILGNVDTTKRYVVQQHVKDPLLTDDGKKAHLKFCVLLVCEADGTSWTLYTYRGALLSISPSKWSPNDLSHDTQITIHRHPQPPGETEGWKQHWESAYVKCQEATTKVLKRAIRTHKLKGRSGKRQFEVFSVDWMLDEHGKIWMFEFNMSPAVAQPQFNDPSKRDRRREWLMEHDRSMLKEALEIVFIREGEENNHGQWDLAGEFCTHIER